MYGPEADTARGVYHETIASQLSAVFLMVMRIVNYDGHRGCNWVASMQPVP